MELIIIIFFSIAIVGFSIIINGEDISKFFSGIFRKRSMKFNKQLICESNNNGDKRYKIMVNGCNSSLYFLSYNDAVFCYEHIKKPIEKYYIYNSIKERAYYEVCLDKCTIYIIPYDETSNLYAYDEINKKYRYVIDAGMYNFNTLEKVYNNILNTEFINSTVVLSNEEVKEINNALDLAITNKDIKQLKELIEQYKELVDINSMVIEKIINVK